MITAERQTKLDKAKQALAAIAGVDSVRIDDYDSAGVNVFIYLKGNKRKLDQRIQDTRRRIVAACKTMSEGFHWLHEPNRIRAREGTVAEYDRTYFKIDLYI